MSAMPPRATKRSHRSETPLCAISGLMHRSKRLPVVVGTREQGGPELKAGGFHGLEVL